MPVRGRDRSDLKGSTCHVEKKEPGSDAEKCWVVAGGFQHSGNKRQNEADVEEKKDMSGLQAAILSLRLLPRRKQFSFYTRTRSDHIAFIKITKQS